METNKETIEKLAKIMYDGLSDGIANGSENFTINSIEFVIALSQVAKVALFNGLTILNVRNTFPDAKWLEAFGDMMFLDIDKNIEMATKNNAK